MLEPQHGVEVVVERQIEVHRLPLLFVPEGVEVADDRAVALGPGERDVQPARAVFGAPEEADAASRLLRTSERTMAVFSPP